MNILVDAHVFDSKYQGTRSHLKGLYSALIPLCKDWTFFLAANDVENLKNEIGEFENVKYVKFKKRNKFSRLLIEIPFLIRKHNIDYSHFQYTILPVSKCKYIVTVHDVLFEQKEFKHYFPLKIRLVNHLLHKFSSKKADILLTVSEFSKVKISQIYNININDIYVTPNAVNDDFYNDTIEIDTPSKFILYVSRVEPRKNHLNLLKAFVELNLKDKGYKLVFIGKKDIPYPEFEAYKSSFQEEIGDSLICIESINNNDLVCYYKNCSLFVFPSFAEGFGIPPLEAMSLQKKVLCSNATAMKDFNLPNEFLFDPNNIEELKTKMISLLENNHDLKDQYDMILSKYNWQSIAEDFKKIIELKNDITN
tara:strand:+ start:9658 stop:10752 length:1095 start_codon:yes stop_codon:yes gene_type:complete